MAAPAPASADVEARAAAGNARLRRAVAGSEQVDTKTHAWPLAWACRRARGHSIATVLLAFASLGFLFIFASLSLFLSPILGSVRAWPPHEEQEAIIRQAVLVGGDLSRPGSPEDQPTPVRVQIKNLPNQIIDVHAQVCLGIDVHNAANAWMAAAKHDHAATLATVAGLRSAVRVYQSLSHTTDRWTGSLVHAALRRLHAAHVQLGPTRINQAPIGSPSHLPEYKLDPIMDSVCPTVPSVSDAEVMVQKHIWDAVASVLSNSPAEMIDITFGPLIVPLRPIEGTASCGSLPSQLGEGNITLYPVHVMAHVVPISRKEAVPQDAALVQPYVSPGQEQRVMTDVRVERLAFAALSGKEAGAAMRQWPLLPDISQGSPGHPLNRIGRLSTWVHGAHGAIDFRVSAPVLRALRCLSGIEDLGQSESNSTDDPSGGWWDRWGKKVQVQLSSATFNPLTYDITSTSLSAGGLAWKVAVQISSALFAPFEIDWPFTVPVEVALPIPSLEAAESASRTLAKVELLPFSLSNGQVLITLQGEVSSLPDIELPGSDDLLGRFFAGLLQGKQSTVLLRGIDGCIEPGEGMRAPYWLCSLWRQFEYQLDLAPLATLIPWPGAPSAGDDFGLPELVQKPAFQNVSLRPHPFGPHKLTITADFTAEVHLPAELDPVDMHLHAIWPDLILVSLPFENGAARAGRVPSTTNVQPVQHADLSFLPMLDDPATWTDVPSEPIFDFPDPLPSGAFAHIRLPTWAATSLSWLPLVESGEAETVRVLHARFVDAPLDTLPGKGAELRKFLWDVTRGEVKLQASGEVGVRASLPALGPHITTLLALPITTNVTVDQA